MPHETAKGFQNGMRLGLKTCDSSPSQSFTFGASVPVVRGAEPSPRLRSSQAALVGRELEKVQAAHSQPPS